MPFNNKIGEVRPNQLVTTFGPGSLVDTVKDSVTILDTNYWKEKGKRISDGRLAAYLGVNCFYTPRTTSNGDLPIASFPYIHNCNYIKCGRLFDIRENFDLDKYYRIGARCPDCGSVAYPSRFIIMCRRGHVDDFPWKWWVHQGDNKCDGKLKMYSTGHTSTLADMIVECEKCGAKRSLSGAMQPENFIDLKCSGNHPFRPRQHKEKCDEKIIPSQRGASNVYFPVIRSAISIPPWTDPLFNLIDEHMRLIEQMTEMKVPNVDDLIFNQYFASNYSREDFDKALAKRRKNIKEFVEIKQMEYLAITHHDDPTYASDRKYFKTEEEEVHEVLKPYFSRIIKITRLRDVMVLLGFTRVDAPDPDANTDEQVNIVPLNKTRTESWLPAVEVNGEGIFIEFNRDSLKKWMNIESVLRMSNIYKKCYEEYCSYRKWNKIIKRDAKYVLLHTFSHLLIKEMSLQSGYSSSAIKERIYATDDMAGILLYTGSSDKEGSLGGLVELGKFEKLLNIIKGAFDNALICSNDPECLSNSPTSEKSNGAACHSCCMISETACENGNRLLDRALVVPLDGREEEAFFRELVVEICHKEV